MSEHSEPTAGTAGPLASGGLDSATGAFVAYCNLLLSHMERETALCR